MRRPERNSERLISPENNSHRVALPYCGSLENRWPAVGKGLRRFMLELLTLLYAVQATEEQQAGQKINFAQMAGHIHMDQTSWCRFCSLCRRPKCSDSARKPRNEARAELNPESEMLNHCRSIFDCV